MRTVAFLGFKQLRRPTGTASAARRLSGGSAATSRRPRYAPIVISPAGGPPPLVAVVGPTATGKSGLGVALAAALGGEVVNADAMALYRGMDIGTAKPRPAERAGVPHHLLDVLDVTETASVAAYQRAARAVVEDLRAAGRTPVLVGGSGLYVQAVVDELEFPGTDPRCGPSSRRSSPSSGPPRCTPGWLRSTPPPRPRCCPATAAGSCGPWRWSR